MSEGTPSMSESATKSPPDDSPTAQGYKAAALSGGGWASAQALAGKLFSVAASFVLAWLLSEQDFGVYGLASTIGTFLLPFAPAVMGDLLVNARDRAVRLYPHASRILVTTCGMSTLLLCLLAIPIERMVGREGLAIAVAVIALRPILGVPGTLALARLRVSLRFRDIAAGGIAVTIANAAGSVILALLGFGPLALAIPLVATQLVGAAIYSAKSRHAADPATGSASMDDARTLRRDYLVANAGQYVHATVSSIDMLLLGAVTVSAVFGRYYFAQNLAIQTNLLFAYGIGVALQPIFAHLSDDRGRQSDAFCRAARALGAVAMPICLIQAALTMPLLDAAFTDEWDGAAIPMIALSIGQAFMFLVGPLTALLRAQGRFTAFLGWQLAHGVAMAACMGVCIALFEQQLLIERAAWCVAAVQAVSIVVGLVVALRGTSHIARKVASIVVVPLACATASAAVLWVAVELAAGWWSGNRINACIMLIGGALLAVGIHAVLVRTFLRETWAELSGEVVRRLPRRRS